MSRARDFCIVYIEKFSTEAQKAKEKNLCARNSPLRKIELNTSFKSNLSFPQLIVVHFTCLQSSRHPGWGKRERWRPLRLYFDILILAMFILIVKERPNIRVFGTTICVILPMQVSSKSVPTLIKLALVIGRKLKSFQSTKSQIVTSIQFKHIVTGNIRSQYIIR